MITAITAVSKSWGIEKNNRPLFYIPDDRKFFRRSTLKNTVIMSRSSLESLPGGKPFKDRRNIILTSDKGFVCEGAEICGSEEEALKLIDKDEKVFLAGGREVYFKLLKYCDTVIVTKVDADPEADAFFPDLDKSPDWVLINTSDDREFEGLKFRYCIYISKAEP